MRERAVMTETERILYEALAAAKAHLDYCGYGDSWEAECAREEKLEEQIQAALDLVKP